MNKRTNNSAEWIKEIAFTSPWARTLQGAALFFLAVATMHTIEERVLIEKALARAFGF